MSRQPWERFRRGRARPRHALLASGASLLGVVLWAALVEPRRVVVRRRTLRLPGWPEGLDGLRVAVMADLHAGGPHSRPGRLERVVARVNREDPDLVVLVGDYVDPVIPGVDSLDPERVAGVLAELRPPLGIVAVLGNHDWYHGGEEVATALRAVGARVLENEAVALDAPGGPLCVAGLADLRTREPCLEQALRAARDGVPVLLLSHDPDVFPQVPPRVALTLAGHLHGAQVDLPWLRRRFVPSRFGTRYADGHVEEGGRHLYVTRGVGTSGLPLRLRAPAGVDVLELAPVPEVSRDQASSGACACAAGAQRRATGRSAGERPGSASDESSRSAGSQATKAVRPRSSP